MFEINKIPIHSLFLKEYFLNWKLFLLLFVISSISYSQNIKIINDTVDQHLTYEYFQKRDSNFKTISDISELTKDTTNYEIEEIDSLAYMYVDPPKENDFISDTNVYKTRDGILKLPFKNDSFIIFHSGAYYSEEYNRSLPCQPYYSYAGRFIKRNFYLIEVVPIYDDQCYFLIDIQNKTLDIIINKPIFSPKGSCYAYTRESPYPGWHKLLAFKILKTNSLHEIFFDSWFDLVPDKLKWVDENSFVFETYSYKDHKIKHDFVLTIKK